MWIEASSLGIRVPQRPLYLFRHALPFRNAHIHPWILPLQPTHNPEMDSIPFHEASQRPHPSHRAVPLPPASFAEVISLRPPLSLPLPSSLTFFSRFRSFRSPLSSRCTLLLSSISIRSLRLLSLPDSFSIHKLRSLYLENPSPTPDSRAVNISPPYTRFCLVFSVYSHGTFLPRAVQTELPNVLPDIFSLNSQGGRDYDEISAVHTRPSTLALLFCPVRFL